MAIPGDRGAAALFSDALRRILPGFLFGDVYPVRPPLPLTGEDGRTHALEALRAYIAEIVFMLPSPPGPSKPFRLDVDRIFIEWPDSMTEKLFPSIEFLPGQVQAAPRGLVPDIDESTVDQFGRDTALVVQYEHVEDITLEVSATTRAQRRMICEGIESNFQPVDGLGELRLRMPRYYNGTVRFSILERLNTDDEDSARRRRRSGFTIRMWLDIVKLVNVGRLKPNGATVEVGMVPPGQSLP